MTALFQGMHLNIKPGALTLGEAFTPEPNSHGWDKNVGCDCRYLCGKSHGDHDRGKALFKKAVPGSQDATHCR